MSGEVILMTLIGGLGTTLGPIVGAMVVVGMQNYLASFGSLVMMVQGVTFMACVLLFREGIVGWVTGLISPARSSPRRFSRVRTSGRPNTRQDQNGRVCGRARGR